MSSVVRAVKKPAFLGGFFLFLAIYFSAISPPLLALGVYDSQRIVQVFFVILYVFFFPPRYIFGGGALFGLVIFFISGLVSVFFSASPLYALLEFFNFLLLVFFSLSVREHCESSKQLVLGGVYFSLWILMLRVLVGVLVLIFLSVRDGAAVLAFGFSNYRHFAEFFVAAAFAVGFYVSGSRWWFLCLVPFFLSWFVVMQSGSRASFLAMIFATVVSLVICRRSAIRSFMCSSASFFSVLLLLLDSAGQSVLREGSSGRFELWGSAVRLFFDSPFFGVGPMHFAFYSGDYAHPHNLVLQILSEWGAVAALALAVLVFSVFSKPMELSGRAECATVSAFGGLVVSSLFGGVLVIPITQLIFFLCCGVILHAGNFLWRRIDCFPSIARLSSIFFFILVAFAFQFRNGNDMRGAVVDSPRFWQDGGIPLGSEDLRRRAKCLRVDDVGC